MNAVIGEEPVELDSLKLLLEPAAKFCLRHSIKLQDLVELCKSALVLEAIQQLEAEGGKVTMSRLSLLTGMHRRDATRLFGIGSSATRRSHSITGKVMAFWQDSELFTSEDGEPRILSYGNDESEFSQLVWTVSKHVHPKTVLLELERLGYVETTPDGVRLAAAEYVPTDDMLEVAKMAATDAKDLMRAVEENMSNQLPLPNLHLITEYDNVVPEAEKTIRQWLLEQGTAFHEQVRQYLASFDKDVHPNLNSDGRPIRVVIGGFSLVEDASQS